MTDQIEIQNNTLGISSQVLYPLSYLSPVFELVWPLHKYISSVENDYGNKLANRRINKWSR